MPTTRELRTRVTPSLALFALWFPLCHAGVSGGAFVDRKEQSHLPIRFAVEDVDRTKICIIVGNASAEAIPNLTLHLIATPPGLRGDDALQAITIWAQFKYWPVDGELGFLRTGGLQPGETRTKRVTLAHPFAEHLATVANIWYVHWGPWES